jgi:ATP-dependent RNA helicase DDX55/SPB4
MVYFATCACVDYFGGILQRLPELESLPVFLLHGKQVPKARTAVHTAFRDASQGVLVCTDIAARGLDIPHVDWVVQVDPPTDPSAFVHRCGRTARLGKEGNALVLLHPAEDTYVEFLRIRHVPLAVRPAFPLPPQSMLPRLRALARADRDLYEKGNLAFVSFIRAYKEHQCSYIFQLKQLDLGRLALGFGLLHLPAMPEIKSKKARIDAFVPCGGFFVVVVVVCRAK